MSKYRSGSMKSGLSNATAMQKQAVSTTSLNESNFEDGHSTIIEQDRNSDEDMEMLRAGSAVDNDSPIDFVDVVNDIKK